MDLDSRYELLEKIGTGSFATVYRARDNELGREVAIKQLHAQYLAEPEHLERYWEEATLLASLQHPNIVTMYDIHRERGWLILELMQATLADRFADRPIDLRSLPAVIAHGLRALKYLHGRGIIHGDVKSANLMIDHRRRVKLGDFGLARRASDDEGSLLKGTTKYMAPEMVSEEFGDVGPASDLYSLGFCAYELMCGPNFQDLFPGLSAFGRNQQIAWMMWHAAPDRRLPEINRVLTGVPDDLAHVIQKLCEKDQSKRYESADEALHDLGTEAKSAASTDSVPHHDDDDTEPKSKSDEKEDKKRLLIAGGALLFSVLLCVFMLWPKGDDKPADSGIPENIGFIRSINLERGQIEWTDAIEGVPRSQPLTLVRDPKLMLTNTREYIPMKELQEGDRIRWPGDIDGEVTELTVSRPIVDVGSVTSTDLQTETILFSVRVDGRQNDLPLDVPERARFFLNDKPSEFGEVRPGDRVRITHLAPLSERGNRVLERLDVQRTNRQVGFYDSYNPNNNTLVVWTGVGDGSISVTPPLADDARISLRTGTDGEGFPVGVNDLKYRDRLAWKADNRVREITAARGDGTVFSGVILGIPLNEQLLRVRPRAGDPINFEIPRTADLTINNRGVRLNDLRPNDQVNVVYEEQNENNVALTVDVVRTDRLDRKVILVATERFDSPKIPPLPYARDSVDQFAETLQNRYGVPEDRLLVLRDRTSDQLRKSIGDYLSQVRGTSQLIVYVCTQGYKTDDGVVLAGTDFNPSNPGDTGLPLSWLVGEIENATAADKLLLFDAAHQGGETDRLNQPSAAEMLSVVRSQLKTTTAISNADTDQKGRAVPGGTVSVFADAMVRAYGGDADRDRNLYITPEEVWDFLPAAFSIPIDGETIRPRRFGKR